MPTKKLKKISLEYYPKYFLCTLTSNLTKKITSYYNHNLQDLGITTQQFLALRVLYYEGDNVGLGEFAKRARLQKSSAVSMIKRLERMGYVSKEPNPNDARLVIIKLTDMAYDMHPKILDKVIELEKYLEKQIGDKNLKQLSDSIFKIVEIDL